MSKPKDCMDSKNRYEVFRTSPDHNGQVLILETPLHPTDGVAFFKTDGKETSEAALHRISPRCAYVSLEDAIKLRDFLTQMIDERIEENEEDDYSKIVLKYR